MFNQSVNTLFGYFQKLSRYTHYSNEKINGLKKQRDSCILEDFHIYNHESDKNLNQQKHELNNLPDEEYDEDQFEID
jgi:hypothetical protein